MKLDLQNLVCPMPVIKTQDQIKKMNAGEILEVVCTDPGALHDIPAWCRIHGHNVLSAESVDKKAKIKIKVSEN